ncbi:MAG: hypothetical protein ACP5JH_03270 [Bacteroidota bacterium]
MEKQKDVMTDMAKHIMPSDRKSIIELKNSRELNLPNDSYDHIGKKILQFSLALTKDDFYGLNQQKHNM